MNTKNTHTAKVIQMNPKPLSSSKALESLLASLDNLDKMISDHFEE